MKRLLAILFLFVSCIVFGQVPTSEPGTASTILNHIQNPDWKSALKQKFWAYEDPLSVHGNTIVATFIKEETSQAHDLFYFFDRQHGNLLRVFNRHNFRLYYNDNNFIYYTNRDSIYALDKSTAQAKLITTIEGYTISYLTKNGNNLYLQAIGDDDTLDCPIYKIDIATGKPTKLMGNVHGNVQQIVDGVLIFSYNSYTFGVELETAKMLWKIDNTHHQIAYSGYIDSAPTDENSYLSFDWKSFTFNWVKDTTIQKTTNSTASARKDIYPKYPATYNDSNAESIHYDKAVTIINDTVSFDKMVIYKNDSMQFFVIKMGLYTGKVYSEKNLDNFNPYTYSVQHGPLIVHDTVNKQGKKITQYYLVDMLDTLSKNWRYYVSTYFPDSAIGQTPKHSCNEDGIYIAEDTDRINLYVAFNNYVWCFNRQTYNLLWTKRLNDISYITYIVPYNGFILLFDLGYRNVAVVNTLQPNDVSLGKTKFSFVRNIDGDLYMITDNKELERVSGPLK